MPETISPREKAAASLQRPVDLREDSRLQTEPYEGLPDAFHDRDFQAATMGGHMSHDFGRFGLLSLAQRQLSSVDLGRAPAGYMCMNYAPLAVPA